MANRSCEFKPMGNSIDYLKENNLTFLDCKESVKSRDEIDQVCELLETNSTVKIVIYPSFDLSDKVEQISKTLSKNNSIQNLKLLQNNFNIQNSYKITQSLSLNPNIPLRYLDLSLNSLGDGSILGLIPFLKNNTTLEQLYLINCDITHEGAILLSQVIPTNKNLRSLHLSHNKIGKIGGESLYESILYNIILTLMVLSDTEVPNDIRKKIHDKLENNKKIQKENSKEMVMLFREYTTSKLDSLMFE